MYVFYQFKCEFWDSKFIATCSWVTSADQGMQSVVTESATKRQNSFLGYWGSTVKKLIKLVLSLKWWTMSWFDSASLHIRSLVDQLSSGGTSVPSMSPVVASSVRILWCMLSATYRRLFTASYATPSGCHTYNENT